MHQICFWEGFWKDHCHLLYGHIAARSISKLSTSWIKAGFNLVPANITILFFCKEVKGHQACSAVVLAPSLLLPESAS